MKEAEMALIAGWIDGALRNRADEAAVTQIRQEVFNLTSRFPIPE
jgi:glycine/serine hydroxymethyltransferase